MIVVYKKIKKRNERKRLNSASNTDNAIELNPVNPRLDGKKKKTVSPEQVAEKRRRNVYRWKIILGLFSPYCLQALDTTIIASALPFIAEDFSTSHTILNDTPQLTTTDQIKQLNWIISVFNLTSAAFLFFWAQLTDLFGRHIILQSAIFIMMIGSAVCTGAPTSSFSVLLLGRALQGIGAAGVNISIRTILADRVSLAEYAVNWTVFALVSGIGFSIGPVIGGYLTQASWRWCFAINLPIAVVAMVIVVFVLRTELQGPQSIPEFEETGTSTRFGRFLARISTIDYGGQMLFLWGFGLLILALTWAGGTYSWNSVAVLAPMVIGAVLAGAWVVYERCMVPGALMARVLPRQKAMVPWELLRQRDIGLLFLINFSIGIAMFAVMYFMDIYFTLVEGRSSSDAGIALLFFLPGLAGMYTSRYIYLYGTDLTNSTSWTLHGDVLIERLAPANLPSPLSGQYNVCCRDDSACVGSASRQNKYHLRHDGASWTRRGDENEPGFYAWIGVFPCDDGADYVSCFVCGSVWGAVGIDYHVDGVYE